MFKYIIVTLIYLYGIDSQIIRQGTCPNANVQENFDIKKFSGVWYEAERYPADFEEGGSCAHHDLNLVSDTEIFEQIFQYVSATGETKITNATAILAGRTDEGKFTVKLYIGTEEPQDTPYWVLETDYDSYAVLYSCSQVDASTTAELTYILGRERKVSRALLEKGYSVYDRENISRKELVTVDQENC